MSTHNDGGDGTAAAPARSLGGRISSFLAQIRPYRELVALVVGIVAAVSASVAWTVSHFATQSQLSSLECDVNGRINSSATSTLKTIIEADEDSRNQRLAALNADTTKTPEQKLAKVLELSAGISNDVQKLDAADAQVTGQVVDVKCKPS